MRAFFKKLTILWVFSKSSPTPFHLICIYIFEKLFSKLSDHQFIDFQGYPSKAHLKTLNYLFFFPSYFLLKTWQTSLLSFVYFQARNNRSNEGKKKVRKSNKECKLIEKLQKKAGEKEKKKRFWILIYGKIFPKSSYV